MLISFTSGTFPTEYQPTVFENYACNVGVDGAVVNLNIYDTAGQEDYDRLRPLSYPMTDVFLLCYSVSNPASFASVRSRWLPELQLYGRGAPVILVGTKADTASDPETLSGLRNMRLHPVPDKSGAELADELGMRAFVPCSAKTGDGLKEAFDVAVRSVIADRRKTVEKHRRRILPKLHGRGGCICM